MNSLKKIAFYLLLLPLAYAPYGQTNEVIPVDILFNPKQTRFHSLSPDGNTLAYLEVKSGKNYLNIVDIDSMTEEHSFDVGGGEVSQMHWLNNYRILYNLNGRIKAINTQGTENIVLIDWVYDEDDLSSYHSILNNWRGWSIVDMIEHDPDHILVSGTDRKDYATLSKVNVYTGDKTDIANGKKYKIENWVVDNSGKPRIGIREKKGKVYFFSINDSNPEKLILEPFVVKGQDLSFDGQSFVDQNIFFSAFSKDDKQIYIVENIKNDKFQLTGYDTTTSTLTNPVFSDRDFDISNLDQDIRSFNDVIIDKNTDSLVGIRYSTGKVKTIWLDKELNSVQQTIDKSQKTTQNLILDWTEDRDKYVVHSISEKNPGKTSIFIKSKNKLLVVSDNPQIYRDYPLAETVFTHYPARDGYRIPAYITKAENSDKNKPSKLIVIPHGGPWARDYYTYDPMVQFFATRGYAVLQPQFRGSRGFGKKHFLSGKKQLMGVMIDDITDGTKWMINNGNIDKNNVFILGISYGGYAALISGIQHPDLYNAIVSLAGPVDLIDQIKQYKKKKLYFAYEYWSTLAGDLSSDKSLLVKSSPVNLLDQIKIPAYVAYGEDDPTVSISQLEKLNKEIKKLKIKIIDTQKFQDEGHGFSKSSNAIYFFEKALKLFKENEK